MERLGDCADDTCCFGIVFDSGIDGRLLDQKSNHTGAHGGLVHERAANLRRCDGDDKALFVEQLPFLGTRLRRDSWNMTAVIRKARNAHFE
jgi:hypothetical protein